MDSCWGKFNLWCLWNMALSRHMPFTTTKLQYWQYIYIYIYIYIYSIEKFSVQDFVGELNKLKKWHAK